jgi:hypothetical protein
MVDLKKMAEEGKAVSEPSYCQIFPLPIDSRLPKNHPFQLLANEVESCIHRFYWDVMEFQTIRYPDISDSRWKLIWMCINTLKQFCWIPSEFFHYYIDRDQESSKYLKVSSERFFVPLKYDSEFMQEWLCYVISVFYPPNVITFDDYYLSIRTFSARQTNEYSNFLQCLFPDFEYNPIPENDNSDGPRHTQWAMTGDVYQQCLELFPRWPIVMSSDWYRKAFEICTEFLIPDLVRICIEYLPTEKTYVYEIPEESETEVSEESEEDDVENPDVE